GRAAIVCVQRVPPQEMIRCSLWYRVCVMQWIAAASGPNELTILAWSGCAREGASALDTGWWLCSPRATCVARGPRPHETAFGRAVARGGDLDGERPEPPDCQMRRHRGLRCGIAYHTAP